MTVDLQKARKEWFQTLQPLRPEEIVGLWRGVRIPSDHPLDGVLENLQWFGKRFHADLRADALLFQWRLGRLVPINPAYGGSPRHNPRNETLDDPERVANLRTEAPESSRAGSLGGSRRHRTGQEAVYW